MEKKSHRSMEHCYGRLITSNKDSVGLIVNINFILFELLDDAKFERQRSIYSPEFYSSHFGYRMCARLFFNGINHRRQGYLSIYFVLMRGNYDALLEWPFPFKISFTLLDQSTPIEKRNDLYKFFWSDRESTCFQRPQLEMNDAYGFEEFISLDQFRQNQHRYLQDDTIFIRIEVDFLNRTSGNFNRQKP